MIGCGTIIGVPHSALSPLSYRSGTGDCARLTRSESPLMGLSDG